MAVNREGGPTGIENRNAPNMKSSWSPIGSELPGDRFSRLLMNDSIRSPVNAPIDIAIPSSKLYWK